MGVAPNVEIGAAHVTARPAEVEPNADTTSRQQIPQFKLQRITSSGQYIPEVDGLRSLAIISTILYHLHGFILAKLHCPGDFPNAAINTIVFHGDFAVECFFAISGFILALPFAERFKRGDHQFKLGPYYKRRITRLEPPYIINIFILAFISYFVKPPQQYWRHFFSTIFYCHSQVYGVSSLFNSVTWSLEVEVQFYIVAPLLASIFLMKNTLLRRAVLLAAISGFAYSQNFVAPYLPPQFGISLLSKAHYFLAGFLLADVYISQIFKRKTIVWDGVFLASIICMTSILCAERGRVLLPFLIVPCYLGVFNGVIFRYALTRTIPLSMGCMCYTTYLYHFQIISGMWRVTKFLQVPNAGMLLNYAIQLFALLACVYAFSVLLYVFFERPFMRKNWHQKLFQLSAAESSLPV